MPATEPEVSVVVIAYRAQPEVVDAVRSLLDQPVRAEILVVNSGGGDVAALLRRAGIAVRSIEYQERLYAGAARNRGIANTTAPVVAFLASDCRASPGWLEARLARHEAGARAVASAMVNSHPRNLVAWAAHLELFSRRLPGLPERLTLRYGVSFDRAIFEEFGLFDETLRTGEDTDFLKRLPPELQPVWEPRVRTIHLNQTRLWPMLVDEYRRGRRYGRDMRRILGWPIRRTVGQTIRQTRHARRHARAGLEGADRFFARAAIPVLRLALVAKALGILAARNDP
jgi:glycosyltransferase involved in cell wall biosynthesis